MSDDHSDHTERDIDDRWPIERRRLLQAAGAGLGSLSFAGFSGEVVSAKTGCADGPFEATYEAGTVNIGRIRADQAKGENPGSMQAASPSDEDELDVSGEQPPRKNAQESNIDQEGPLTIRTEYDGVNSLETRGGVPSDSQVAAGDGQLLHVLNRNIAIYNKQSGKREQFFPLERLWEPVIPEPEGGFVLGVPFVFDPRARYDRNEDRYIICATQFQFGLADDGSAINREDVEELPRRATRRYWLPPAVRQEDGSLWPSRRLVIRTVHGMYTGFRRKTLLASITSDSSTIRRWDSTGTRYTSRRISSRPSWT